MAPIPTVYDGIEYRSRLEARWAAFMSNIGWEFTYEPFDGDGYIPDFIVHGDRPMVIEVKPAVTLAEFKQPTGKIEYGLADYQYDVLVVGADPLPAIKGGAGDDMVAGWLGENNHGNPYGDPDYTWDTGHWTRCTNCRSVAVFHGLMSFACRPCGCYDGDHYLGVFPERVLRSTWADAVNSVKWRGRAA